MPAANESNDVDARTAPDERALSVTEESRETDSVPAPTTDANSTLLPGSEYSLSSTRSPRGRRALGWSVLALIVFLVAGPIGAWIRYQSAHVISTNAIVRGHLGEIGTQLDGIVTKVDVDAGDRVQEGQPLVRLDDRQLRAEEREARATVEGLVRELEVENLAIEHEKRQIRQQLQESSANLRAAEAQSDAARIRADDARRFHEVRAELFAGSGAVSGEDVRDAETNRRTADALYQATLAEKAAARSSQDKARLASDALTIRQRRLGVLEAELLRAQARLSRVEADLESAIIRAPENGAIIRRIVQAGSSVEVGQPIMSMRLGKEVWIEAWIDEDDIADVATGTPATVTLQSFPGREFVGAVDKIGLATDYEMPASEVPQPRYSRMRGAPVIGVRIALDEPPAELLPGLSAVVAIQTHSN